MLDRNLRHTRQWFAVLFKACRVSHNKDFRVYRQTLYQLVLRARTLGALKVSLGFAAAVEKKKVGAIQIQAYAYIHSKDTFNMEVLAALKENSAQHTR